MAAQQLEDKKVVSPSDVKEYLEGWRGPKEAHNQAGRPKKTKMDILEKKTNREIRELELLSLVRKFKPLQTKAIQAAARIIDNDEAADANKLKAAALLIQTYRQLLLDTYDRHYDDDVGEEVQQHNAPVFSLRVINPESDVTDVAFKD
jgi:hypothetical protein